MVGHFPFVGNCLSPLGFMIYYFFQAVLSRFGCGFCLHPLNFSISARIWQLAIAGSWIVTKPFPIIWNWLIPPSFESFAEISSNISIFTLADKGLTFFSLPVCPSSFIILSVMSSFLFFFIFFYFLFFLASFFLKSCIPWAGPLPLC
jgi:hypothetical protein